MGPEPTTTDTGDRSGVSRSAGCEGNATPTTCAEAVTGGGLIMARSILAALLPRCSGAGASAFIMTRSKAREMYGRSALTSGEEKRSGLFFAVSFKIHTQGDDRP